MTNTRPRPLAYVTPPPSLSARLARWGVGRAWAAGASALLALLALAAVTTPVVFGLRPVGFRYGVFVNNAPALAPRRVVGVSGSTTAERSPSTSRPSGLRPPT